MIKGKWDNAIDNALDVAMDSAHDGGVKVKGARNEWDDNTVNEKPVSLV
jgi:hypothetical protein